MASDRAPLRSRAATALIYRGTPRGPERDPSGTEVRPRTPIADRARRDRKHRRGAHRRRDVPQDPPGGAPGDAAEFEAKPNEDAHARGDEGRPGQGPAARQAAGTRSRPRWPAASAPSQTRSRTTRNRIAACGSRRSAQRAVDPIVTVTARRLEKAPPATPSSTAASALPTTTDSSACPPNPRARHRHPRSSRSRPRNARHPHLTRATDRRRISTK
jgi:hypothetical protein